MLKAYQSKKVVLAEPMTSTKWLAIRGQYPNYSDASLEDGLEGYHVVYNAITDKEYHSWSPKVSFEEGHSDLSLLDLTQCVNANIVHPKIIEAINDLLRRIDGLSKEDKDTTLKLLADESVNLVNEGEHKLFANILFYLGSVNNVCAKRHFKLDERKGFSTYTVGHHGWLKEIHATTDNHNLGSFIKLVGDTIDVVTK